MAHKEQIDFCKKVKAKFPDAFAHKWVLDCGSLDINGNNRYLFEHGVYMGLDIGHGANVDIVSPIHQFNCKNEMFDTVISTECFEHDMYYIESVWNIIRMLKGGGLFVFTCATNGRAEHGTARSCPGSAPLLQNQNALWANYYKNLTHEDFESRIDFKQAFSQFEWEYNNISHDIYFYGIKRHNVDVKTILK
jgi:hypothetical protein